MPLDVDRALFQAAWFEHVRSARLDKVRQGLDHGMSVNAQRSGLYGLENALFSLMDHADTQVLELLVDRGIELTSRNEQGMTALHQMAGMGNAVIVDGLLYHGLPVDARDARGRTALYWAATNAHVAVATVLIGAGADPLLNALDGHNPLALAHHNGQAEMVALLEHRVLHGLADGALGQTLNRPRL